MNKELFLRGLKRFARVYVMVLVVLLPAVPQEWGDIRSYLIKLGMAGVIALIAAGDKIIRDLVKNN